MSQDYPDSGNILDLQLEIDQVWNIEEACKIIHHQRNVLAQEIKDFLVKTGIIVENCCPNGPELILALRDAAELFKPKVF